MLLPPKYLALVSIIASASMPITSALNTLSKVTKLAKSDTKMQRMAYLIFNPVAGDNTDPKEELKQIYSTLEPDMPVSVLYTDPDKDPYEQCKDLVDAIQARPDDSRVQPILVASGGDGTVSAVARAVVKTNIPFGVIPRGTANAFAAALDIPDDIEGACRVLLDGNERVVDTVEMDEECGGGMVMLAGIGFEANMVEHANAGIRKKIMGPLAYVVGGFKQLINPEPFECEISIDDKEDALKITANAITVATIAPVTSISAQGTGDVIPDDGLLDVTVQISENMMESVGAMGRLVGAAFSHEAAEEGNIVGFRAKKICVRNCSPKQRIVVDGELFDPKSDFTFSVVPDGLRLIAPEKKDS